mmetsp:Transcript_26615/g.39548  ORF Transcript_26615/g.39548 Transcript_26615/m.39548 type:complete len:105 (+) Transcript_26615:264-578(+)
MVSPDDTSCLYVSNTYDRPQIQIMLVVQLQKNRQLLTSPTVPIKSRSEHPGIYLLPNNTENVFNWLTKATIRWHLKRNKECSRSHLMNLFAHMKFNLHSGFALI